LAKKFKFDESLMATLKGGLKERMENDQSGKEAKLQHFLAAPEVPTISQCMAQHIWDLEFVEMEDFLPSNNAVQVLFNLEGPKGLAGGVAIQQQSHWILGYLSMG